jgi:co-chaperonin GroES (HSP10)
MKTNETGIHPCGVAVLVEPYEPELGNSLIAIPDTVRQSLKVLENRVRVIETGPAAWSDEEVPRAKPGDVVLITKHAGAVVTSPVNSQMYRMVNDRDIYCRLDEVKK